MEVGRFIRVGKAYCGVVTLMAGPGKDWDSHLLLLYRDEDHRQASVGSWIQRGLDRGEKVFYSTAPDDPASMSELQPGTDGVARAVRQGQFTFIPLEELFPGAAQPAMVRAALAEGYPGVRFSAQANAALGSVGDEDYQAIDHLMDELCARLPVSALCQYNAARNDGRTLATVIDCHPDAVRDAQMRLRRLEDRVALAGAVDLGSAEVLAHALHRICQLDGSSEVVLDLSELTFVDVAGCRALVTGTDGLRRAGGTVICRGASGHIGKVMSLLGLDRLHGMALA